MNRILITSVFLACFLLALTDAQAKEKQIKLEDIERDNLAAERHVKGFNPPQSQITNAYLPKSHLQSHAAGTPTPPRMQFGFVPLKQQGFAHHQPQQYQQYYQYATQSQAQPHSQQQQVQQEYQYVTPSSLHQVHGHPSHSRYANPHAHSHTQAYLPTPQTASRHPQPHIQYAQPQVTETPEVPEVPSAPNYSQGQQIQAYASPIQSHAYQQYMQPVPNAQTHTQVQYIPSNQLQQYQQVSHPQSQIQYIVDNSIQQSPDQQKYYHSQQYVYLQPYQTPSASNNIHSVSDTKGNVQYVMYIPTAAAYPTETVLAYPTNQEEYVYQTPVPQEETKAVQVDYPEEKPYRQIQRPVFKHQPTSLLDSYVPSYLQYEYYKQQQQNVNALKQSTKLSSVGQVGKGDIVKSYKENNY